MKTPRQKDAGELLLRFQELVDVDRDKFHTSIHRPDKGCGKYQQHPGGNESRRRYPVELIDIMSDAEC